MSRLPRLIEPRAEWLRGLRAALRCIQKLGATLVTVEGTAGSTFVRRGAERLSVDVETLANGAGSQPTQSVVDPDIPEKDRLLLSAAEMILVLGLRANGYVHHLLRSSLAEGRRVTLLDLPSLQARAAREDLMALGATLWRPTEEEQRPLGDVNTTTFDESVPSAACEIAPIPTGDGWEFLSHTTRSCPGPWPGQDTTEYVDSLLDDSDDADHSAVATLSRIVRRRLLRASSRLIRGRFPVVCLTQISLQDLPKVRQYRAHRTRWDFEPFGLCINREWLQERGARPVIYGVESTWPQLSEADRPFFQCVRPPEADTQQSGGIDWAVEQEWRHVGDLDLRKLPADAAYVFVPDFESAKRLAPISPWPITLWAGG